MVDKLITGLPEMVRALASPLSKVDKITIVSTGNGDSAGMHKITGDMTQMAAQVPALFEALSGMKMANCSVRSDRSAITRRNRMRQARRWRRKRSAQPVIQKLPVAMQIEVKGVRYGTARASCNIDPRESERSGR